MKLWSSIGHSCLLGLTVLLLLFEIIVSRLCSCLINMVDGFHTLYILLHLSLQRPWATHTPPDSSPPASPSPSPLAPSPHFNSSNSHIPSCSHTDSSLPSIPPHLDLNNMSPCGPLPDLSHDITSPPSCIMPSRTQPFGALFSALVVASLCVSVTLEILNHIFQPHPIQRPILATVASALSLFFNAIILLRPVLVRLGLQPAKSASVSVSAAEPQGLGSSERGNLTIIVCLFHCLFDSYNLYITCPSLILSFSCYFCHGTTESCKISCGVLRFLIFILPLDALLRADGNSSEKDTDMFQAI